MTWALKGSPLGQDRGQCIKNEKGRFERRGEARIPKRKMSQSCGAIWRALSEKREGSSGNPSFFTFSRSDPFLSFFLLPLLLLLLLRLLLLISYHRTASPFMVTLSWPPVRPMRSVLFFYPFIWSDCSND